MPKRIVESGAVKAQPTAGGNMLIQLITPGTGSSGEYSAEVLESAAQDRVFPAGTLMFADHPGEAEMYDRPERSIRDVAGVLVEDARWDGGALVAEAKTYGPWTQVLTEMADAIGVSIRASAEVGEAKPGQKPTISRLVEAVSVDFVTHAGRGGAIREVYESARSRANLIVRDATDPTNLPRLTEAATSQTSERLSELVRDTYKGDAKDVYVWVRDFDPEAGVVWYEVEGGAQPGIWQEGYTLDAEEMPTLSGNRFEVVQRTEYVPIKPATESGSTTVPAPAGQPHPIPSSEENTMGHIQVDEADHGRLTEAAGRVPTLESERDTAVSERDSARAELALFKAREAARPAVAAKVAESSLPATRKAKIVEAVLRHVALNDQGMPNAEELVKLTEAEVKDAETELAELAESLGVGQVVGFGGSSRFNGNGDVTEADVDKAIATAFGRQIKEA
jgi:phenylpyruvate tautomerase PptA (4-oxalocrotonate tautomerase family)